jgi:F-type H+-transporting ATPase subunit b
MNAPFVLASIAGDLVASGRTIKENFGLSNAFYVQVVSFVIVCLVLRAFAYKPILSILEARRKKIAESMANADRIKVELEHAQAKRHEILQHANQQAAQMIEEAREAAQRVHEQETKAAAAAAAKILEKAREEAKLEAARQLADAKKELAQLLGRLAEQGVGRVLTGDDQARLTREVSQSLAAKG